MLVQCPVHELPFIPFYPVFSSLSNACSSSNDSLRYCSSSIALQDNHCRTVYCKEQRVALSDTLQTFFSGLIIFRPLSVAAPRLLRFPLGGWSVNCDFSLAGQVRRARRSQLAQQRYTCACNVRVRVLFFTRGALARLHHSQFRDLCCCCLQISKTPSPTTTWQLTWQVR